MGSAAIVGGLVLLGKNALDTASMMQQASIAFEVMLGSGAKSTQLLKEINKFAMETPFTLPEVVEGSKRLLAYNIAAQDIIPTFKMLGDIAAGVGKDKLPQLIIAFGQVKAATKLTGMELRQFTEAGVPLLEALVNKANETGGALTKIGGTSAATMKKMASLSSTIADQEFRMKLLTDAGKNQGVTWEMLKRKYGQNVAELKTFGSVGAATFIKVKQTASEFVEKISDGAVKFEEVQAALKGLTDEGGRFHDLMKKLAQESLVGILSNISDAFSRLAISALGWDEELGKFGDNSLMLKIQRVAQAFLTFAQTAGPAVASFVNQFMQNMPAVTALLGALAGLVTPLVIAFIGMIAPALAFAAAGAILAVVFKTMADNMNIVTPILVGIGAAFTAFAFTRIPLLISTLGTLVTTWVASFATMIATALPLLWPFILIGAAVAALYLAWTNNWGGIQEKTKVVVDWITLTAWPALQIFFNAVTGAVVSLADAFGLNWGNIKKFVGDVVVWFETYVAPTLEKTFKIMKTLVKNLADDYIEKFKSMQEEVKMLTKAFGDLLNFIKDTFLPDLEKHAATIKKIMSLLIPDQVKQLGIWKGAWEAVSGAINGVLDAVNRFLQTPLGKDTGTFLIKKMLNLPFATGGVVPGPIGAPVLATVHGGETVVPVGRNSNDNNSGGGSTFNVYVGMYAGTETEKRNIARDLYAALVQVASSQNKTVQKMMRG